MNIALRFGALGVLLGHVAIGVREQGGNNRGAVIKQYLASCDPPLPEGNPWCAAVIQFATDVTAKGLGTRNPLDDVKLEAYVQSYVDWAIGKKKEVSWFQTSIGDLVCFSFGGSRYDHIGMVLSVPDRQGRFKTIEGNTSDSSQRDGDALAVKTRTIHTGHKPVTFIRWSD